MKTVIIPFEQMVPRSSRPELNLAIIEVTVPENVNENALVHSIVFSKPVKAVSHYQLTELLNAIENNLKEVEGTASTDLAVSAPGMPVVSEKGIAGMRNGLYKMFKGMESGMSSEDKNLANQTFGLIDKLLGKK